MIYRLLRTNKHLNNPSTLNLNDQSSSSGNVPKKESELMAEIIPDGILQNLNSIQKSSKLIETGHNGIYINQNVGFQANPKTCKCCGNHYSLPYGFCSLTCAEKLYFGSKKYSIVNYS